MSRNKERSEPAGTPQRWLIRPAEVDDAEQIAAFCRRLTRRHISAELPEEARQYLDEALGAGQVRANMAGDGRYFVAEEQGRLVGVVAMRGNRHLLKLFVAEEVQGNGLGRALWERARAAARAAGHRGGFTVSAAPGAVPVYERLGFVASGPATTEQGVTRVPMATTDQPSD